MASFEDDIKVKLSADLTGLKRGLEIAKRDIASVGEDAGRVIKRKLGGGDAFKSLLTAFTISAEGIANNIAAAIAGGSKEGWEEAGKAAEAYGELLERQALKLKTFDQQADFWRRRQAEFSETSARPQKQFGYAQTSLGRTVQWATGIEAAKGVANRMGWFGAENQSDAAKRQAESGAKAIQAGEMAEEAAKKQKEINQAVADELESRRLIGKEEGAQVLSLRKRYEDKKAEAALLAKSNPVEAAIKELEAQKLLTAERRLLVSIEQKHLKHAEEMGELSREQAAKMETDTEKINRLRAEALELQKRSFDNSRTIDQRNGDILKSQQKINAALDAELNLRKSNLGIAEIAAKGGSSARGQQARRAQRLREEADEAAARGNFGTAERKRGQAQSIEEGLQRQEREYLQGANKPAQSDWDKRNGQTLQDRRDNLDAGIAMGKGAARGKSRMAQIMESQMPTTKPAPIASELKTALDDSTVLKSIDSGINKETT